MINVLWSSICNMIHRHIFFSCILVTFTFFLTWITVVEGERKPHGCIYLLSSKHGSMKRIHEYGIQTGFKLRTFLGKHPEKFRLRPGGVGRNQKGMVAIESISHPGHYLRHKNYRFHLEKPSKNELFLKDTTFHMIKLQNRPLLYSFELAHHPSWYMKYNKNRNFKLSLGHVKRHRKHDFTSFYIKQVRCKGMRKDLHKAQKKAIIAGSDTLVETDDDDDHNDGYDKSDDNIQVAIDGKPAEKISSDVNTPKGSENSDTIIKVEEEPYSNTSQREQDIIKEIKHAFKVAHSEKKQQTLNSLESDIDKKVNKLALQLQNKHAQKNNESSDVVIKIDDPDSQGVQHSGIPEYRFPENTSKNTTKLNKLQRKEIKISSSNSSKTEQDENSNLDIHMKIGQKLDKGHSNMAKHNQSTNLRLQVNTPNVHESQQYEKQVEKGSPKLVKSLILNLGLPVNTERSVKDDKMLHDSQQNPKQVEKDSPKIANDKSINPQLPANTQHLSKENMSEHNSQQNKTQVEEGSPKLVNNNFELIARASVAPRYKQDKQHDENLSRLFDYIQTIKPQQAVVKVSEKVPAFKNKTTTSPKTMIYFSEKCDNVFPNVCEEWAKKRYCLTFNELMKRYCKKACKLCDHVITTGFTQCDKSCGGGIRLRMIKVNNRQVLQRRACNTQHCPIDGGYTPFSNFSDCSATPCGSGLRYQHRSCTQPPPQFGGRDCSRFGGPVRTRPCYVHCKEITNNHRHKSHRKPKTLLSTTVKSRHHSGVKNEQPNDIDHSVQNKYDKKIIRRPSYGDYQVTVTDNLPERGRQFDYSGNNMDKQGMFEYNYDESTDRQTNTLNSAPRNPLLNVPLDNQATTALGKALDEDTSELARSSFMQQAVSDSPKASLSEELAAENEEALNEKRYEESVARQSLRLRPY